MQVITYLPSRMENKESLSTTSSFFLPWIWTFLFFHGRKKWTLQTNCVYRRTILVSYSLDSLMSFSRYMVPYYVLVTMRVMGNIRGTLYYRFWNIACTVTSISATNLSCNVICISCILSQEETRTLSLLLILRIFFLLCREVYWDVSRDVRDTRRTRFFSGVHFYAFLRFHSSKHTLELPHSTSCSKRHPFFFRPTESRDISILSAL